MNELNPPQFFVKEGANPAVVEEAKRDGFKTMFTFNAILESMKSRGDKTMRRSGRRFTEYLGLDEVTVLGSDVKELPLVSVMKMQKDGRNFVAVFLNPQFHILFDSETEGGALTRSTINAIGYAVDYIRDLRSKNAEFIPRAEFAEVGFDESNSEFVVFHK